MGLPPVRVAERRYDDRRVLLWQARGSSTCVLDGERTTIAAGHALWIPAGVAHALHVAPDSVVLPLHVLPEPPPGVLREPTWIRVDADLRTLLLALLQAQTSIIRPEIDLERRVTRMLQERTVPSTGLPLPVSGPARRIAELLRDHPEDQRAVIALAAEHHVSVRTIERSFRAETGLTLREWRLRRRMEIARSLLARGHAPDAVAPRVGYRSASAFRRAFAEHAGMPPGEYSRRHRLPV